VSTSLTSHFIRFNCSLRQISNQQLEDLHKEEPLKSRLSIGVGKKVYLSDFEHGMLLGSEVRGFLVDWFS